MTTNPRTSIFSTLVCLAMLALPAFANAQSAGALDYTAAKALADKDEASLGRDEGRVLLDAQGRLMGDGVARCATPDPDFAPFVVVMELDATGKVVRTWLDGSSPLAICFRKFVAQGALMPPPRAPFYSAIELSFTK